MKNPPLLLFVLLCLLSSCASRRDQTAVKMSAPPGTVLHSRQFVIERREKIECFSASRGGSDRPEAYAIFRNGRFEKMVRRLPSYKNGRQIKEPALDRALRTLRQPPLEPAAAGPLKPKPETPGREPMNILPAFILIAPLLVVDAVQEARFLRVTTGDSTWSLPQRLRWRRDGDYLVNHDLGGAVKVSSGRITELFDGDFFHCQF